MGSLWLDLRYAVRALAAAPTFTISAVATLAIGIGASTAILSAVHAVLLTPLPFPDSDRLVRIGELDSSGEVGNVGYTTYEDWRDRSRSFEAVATMRGWNPTLVTDEGAERIAGVRVSWTYFGMLGQRPALGRDFTADEDRPERWHVVVLSDGLWRRRFGADPAVVGRSVQLNGRPYRVVGVMPASFEPVVSASLYEPAEIWAPIGYDRSEPQACRTCRHLKALGRLRADLTMAEAAAELDAVHRQLRGEHPTEYADRGITLVRLHDAVVGGVRPALFTLLAAVFFVLLIGCANVASLTIARATSRRREMAMRAALGASRARLAVLQLAESGAVALVGGASGVALALLLMRTLGRLEPAGLPGLSDAGPNVAALAFAAGLTTASGLLVGLAPVVHGRARDLHAWLKDVRQSAGRSHVGARSVLVVVDVMLALMLLAGAGLMARTVVRLLDVDPGFDPRGVLTMNLSLVGPEWAEDRQVLAFIEDLVARVESLPGVEAAGVTGQIPLGGNYDRRGIEIEGRPAQNPAEAPALERYSVTPDYLEVMRIPLRRGRAISERDRADSPPIVLVGETTARSLWPGGDPIGRRIRFGGPDAPWRTIVGIVGDVRHYALGTPPTMQMYVPQAQVTDSFLVLVARSAIEPAALASAVREEVRALAPGVPVYDVAPLADLVSRSVAPRRYTMLLLAVFAGAALLLTAVGVYGLAAFVVVQRTKEVGIRMALGAGRSDIARLLLWRGGLLIAVGVGLGTIAALALTRLLADQLYGVTPTDPVTFVGVVLIVAVVGLAAHLVPLRRATRVDPMVTLRAE